MKTLKQYITEVIASIEEAAITPGQAQSSGVALFSNFTPDVVQYVLYEVVGGRINIIGYMHLDDHNGYWEVKNSAAQKGYGPLLYDIALSDAPIGVFPDRYGVSESARVVWRKYWAQRKDVTKEPLPNELDPRYLNYLDLVYKLKSPVNVAPLAVKHKEIVAEQPNGAEFKKLLLRMGVSYFHSRYEDE